MADQHFLRLEVVDPDGPVFQGDVAMVILPAAYGELGILPQHAPLVCQLTVGEMRVKTLDGDWMSLSVSDGFAKVQFDKVIVLADAAELASEIDAARAEKALALAQKRLEALKAGGLDEEEEIDAFREGVAVTRAKNRLKVAKKA